MFPILTYTILLLCVICRKRNDYYKSNFYINCVLFILTQVTSWASYSFIADRWYIPLLRATDNSSPAVIGAPWSPDPSDTTSHSFLSRLACSPKDPVMTVRAFAGPLGPSKVLTLVSKGFEDTSFHSVTHLCLNTQLVCQHVEL